MTLFKPFDLFFENLAFLLLDLNLFVKRHAFVRYFDLFHFKFSVKVGLVSSEIAYFFVVYIVVFKVSFSCSATYSFLSPSSIYRYAFSRVTFTVTLLSMSLFLSSCESSYCLTRERNFTSSFC